MAKKHVEEITAQPPGEEITAQGTYLVSTGFLKCDGVRYQPGDSFPIDHPEAERLFELGAVKER